MKIAVPTRDNRVDGHFGHCDTYTIFQIDESNQVQSKEVLKWSHGCGCRSNIVGTLRDMGVGTLLAGNMGRGAMNKLRSHQMNVVRGCEGNVDELVNTYLQGKIKDQEILCQTHENCEH